MPTYNVTVGCPECGAAHEVKTITLDAGPARRMNVRECFGDGELPAGLDTVSRNYMFCPQTKKWFFQHDMGRVFIAPAGTAVSPR